MIRRLIIMVYRMVCTAFITAQANNNACAVMRVVYVKPGGYIQALR